MSVSRRQILKLYKDLIREAGKFPAYNFRSYGLRRIKDSFLVHKSVDDPKLKESLYLKGLEDLAMLKRQVIIASLYKTEELVIEKPENIEKLNKELKESGKALEG